MSDVAEAEALSLSARLLLTLSLTAGLTVGLAPLALALDIAWLVGVIAVSSAAMSAIVAARSNTVRTEPVLAGEWFAAAGSTAVWGLGLAAGIGIGAVFWYGLVWLVNLTPWVEWPAYSVALWISLLLGALSFVLNGYAELAANAQRLFPSDPPGVSVFTELVRNSGLFLGLSSVILILILTVSILLLGTSNWTVLIWFVTIAVWGLAWTPPPLTEYESGEEYAKIVNEFSKALTVHDYNVIASPETGDPSVDAFLKNVDLYADGESGAIVVDIRLQSPRVDWEVASQGMTAATFMQGWQTLDEESELLPHWIVQPVLILLDTQPQDDLAAFCQEFGVGLAIADTSGGDPSCSGRPDLRDVMDSFLAGIRTTRMVSA